MLNDFTIKDYEIILCGLYNCDFLTEDYEDSILLDNLISKLEKNLSILKAKFQEGS